MYTSPSTDISYGQTSRLVFFSMVPLDMSEVDTVSVLLTRQTKTTTMSTVVIFVEFPYTWNNSSYLQSLSISKYVPSISRCHYREPKIWKRLILIRREDQWCHTSQLWSVENDRVPRRCSYLPWSLTVVVRLRIVRNRVIKHNPLKINCTLRFQSVTLTFLIFHTKLAVL